MLALVTERHLKSPVPINLAKLGTDRDALHGARTSFSRLPCRKVLPGIRVHVEHDFKKQVGIFGAYHECVSKPVAGIIRAATTDVCLLVDCLLNVPATCLCISGTDLLRQFCVLPH